MLKKEKPIMDKWPLGMIERADLLLIQCRSSLIIQKPDGNEMSSLGFPSRLQK
jgi:hypothetical protein